MRLRLLPLLLALVALPAFVPTAEAACIKRHDVRIASGTSPSGWAWTVDGAISSDSGHCRGWMFGMDFELQGATNWGWGIGIPAGGHLGPGFSISSFDDLLLDGSYRVVSGTVNGKAAKVVFTLSNNKHVTIYPKAPPEHLRRKVVWLRNVRYFVNYYPPEGFVTGVATFSASGQLLYRDKNLEGF